jgi:aspartate aminotransferase-like enzyme
MPLIGQFDPDFTEIMDDVMAMARPAFRTSNARCFPVSGLAQAGLEALLNTLVEDGQRVAIGGGPRFFAETADIARRLGADVQRIDDLGRGTRLAVAPLVDPTTAQLLPIHNLATSCHVLGARLIVEATLGLAACELRVDDWHVDACSAGVDYALGAPSGMALVTYSAEVEALMQARQSPPPTSYLDLLQLQTYWSPERLNHHTAPTSLIYGLREALRLLHDEGLTESWTRHRRVGDMLRHGLDALGLDVGGTVPYAVVRLPESVAESPARRDLLEQFGIHVTLVGEQTWRVGLIGADAQPETAQRVLTALHHLLSDNVPA